MAFDLKKVDIIGAAEKGYTFPIKYTEESVDKKGNPVSTELDTGMTVSVLGIASRKAKVAHAKFQAKSEQNEKLEGIEKEDAQNESICEFLAECVTGWDGAVYDGEVIEFKPEGAKDLLLKFPFIQNQVFLGIMDVKGQLGNL